MPKPKYETALIVGAGSGLSASLARLLAGEGLRVALAARNSEKLAPLCAETGAKAIKGNHVIAPAFLSRRFRLAIPCCHRGVSSGDIVVQRSR